MTSSTLRTLLALIVGLAAGIALATVPGHGAAAAVAVIEPVGTVWIDAIRMTVIPLVITLVISGVGGATDLRRVGRLGAWAVPVFVALLVAGGLFTMVVAPAVMRGLTIAPEVAASLRASAGAPAVAEAARHMPSLTQRIVDMVPVNPLKAAADGAVLPVLVFTLVLGLAIAQLDRARQEALVGWFRALADALLVIVGWILAVAPIGIFALAVPLGFRMGMAAAGAIIYYVATLSGIALAVTLLLYPVAVVAGRMPLRRFARAVLPAQAVAFSTRSSLAALPALLAAARDTLGLPPIIDGFVLPLAVTLFRVNVPIGWIVGALFLGKLYGVHVGAAQLLTIVATGTLLSFSVPGIPSASLFLLVPLLVNLGLPPEGVGLLIAVDAIPDMCKTTANVTAHLTAATILARVERTKERGAA
ncbi:MAG: dicarboxylate/amino acid:cation symporter [Acidobacteriota bacterium]|nr:dicarboxylate/amino acid:cation symporter [Acidobacteriota bacterium]